MVQSINTVVKTKLTKNYIQSSFGYLSLLLRKLYLLAKGSQANEKNALVCGHRSITEVPTKRQELRADCRIVDF